MARSEEMRSLVQGLGLGQLSRRDFVRRAAALGVSASGGAQILSYGNNRLIQNPSSGPANDGAFIGGAQPTQ